MPWPCSRHTESLVFRCAGAARPLPPHPEQRSDSPPLVRVRLHLHVPAAFIGDADVRCKFNNLWHMLSTVFSCFSFSFDLLLVAHQNKRYIRVFENVCVCVCACVVSDSKRRRAQCSTTFRGRWVPREGDASSDVSEEGQGGGASPARAMKAMETKTNVLLNVGTGNQHPLKGGRPLPIEHEHGTIESSTHKCTNKKQAHKQAHTSMQPTDLPPGSNTRRNYLRIKEPHQQTTPSGSVNNTHRVTHVLVLCGRTWPRKV